MGNVADVSEIKAASICVYTGLCFGNPWGRVAVGTPSGPIGTVNRKNYAREVPSLLKTTECAKRPGTSDVPTRPPIQVLSRHNVAYDSVLWVELCGRSRGDRHWQRVGFGGASKQEA